MITATWNAPNSAIAPTLGRNLSACGAAAVCTATAQVPLIDPGAMYESRRTQVDLRLTKRFRLSQKTTLEADFDLYNAFNASNRSERERHVPLRRSGSGRLATRTRGAPFSRDAWSNLVVGCF